MRLINKFTTGTFKVTRSLEGYYYQGMWQEGEKVTMNVSGSMQPLTAREVKLLEEGDRLKQTFKFYTSIDIRTIGSEKLSAADRIEINGESFKVLSVEYWEGTSLPYFKSILSREPQNK